MDNVNICLQLEGLGFKPLISDKGILSAFKMIESNEFIYEIKEYSNIKKTTIVFMLNNLTIFKAIVDNDRAFVINYAISLYHIRHHIIKTLKESNEHELRKRRTNST